MQVMLCEKTKIEYLKRAGSSSKSCFILHGYGASMNDLFGLADFLDPDKTLNWFFPNGVEEVLIGPHMTGRAWFPIDMQQLQMAMMQGKHREFSDKEPENFDGILNTVKDFINLHCCDDIILGGFSQGAMMTSHLLTKLDKNVKAFICFSGTLISADRLGKSLESANGISLFQSHGKNDQVLEYRQAMNLFEMLKQYKITGEFVSFEGGHEIPMPVLTACKKFLSSL